MNNILLYMGIIILFGWANRFETGEYNWLKIKSFDAKTLFESFAIFGICVAGYIIFKTTMIIVMTMVLAWMLCSKWPNLFHSACPPRSEADKISTLANHSIPAIATTMFFCMNLLNFNWFPMMITMYAYACIATFIDIDYTKIYDMAAPDEKSQDTLSKYKEKMRTYKGYTFGIASAIGISLGTGI